MVGIGVRFGLHHLGDDEFFKALALVFDAFDFEADSGQGRGNLIDTRFGIEMILEPIEGEFHWYMLSVASIRGSAMEMRGRWAN